MSSYTRDCPKSQSAQILAIRQLVIAQGRDLTLIYNRIVSYDHKTLSQCLDSSSVYLQSLSQ